jgi:hypothetical protein
MANELEMILKARDDASKVVNGLGATFERNRKKIGLAMTGAGAAIVGFAGLSLKSSQDQAIGVNELTVALERVGVSYASEKSAIEASISALQAKTNFGDEAQRKSLTSLSTLTGDYEISLAALPAVLDVAASMNMDLNAASLLVGKALSGQASALTRYGIQLEEGATQTEIIAALTAQFGGSAEAAADPMVQLGNQIGDVQQILGDALLPILNDVIPRIGDMVKTVQDWTAKNPALTKIILLGVTALGALMLVLGPILIVLPAITAAAGSLGVVMGVLLGPVGLVILVIVALIAVGVLLWKNWDTISAKATEVFNAVLDRGKAMGNGLIGVANAVIGAFQGMLNGIATAINSIPTFRIPSWVPGIGGNEFGLPNIPTINLPKIPLMDHGGLLQGPGLFAVGPGVTEIARAPSVGADGAGMTVNIFGDILDGADFERKLVQANARLKLRGA